RPFRRGIHRRPDIARRLGEAVGPPTTGGVEDEVALGARVDGGGVGAVVVAVAVGGHAGGEDFEAGEVGGVAVPFPADQAGDGVAALHAGAVEDPVVGLGAGPVGPAGDVASGAGAHQRVLVRAHVGQAEDRVETLLGVLRAVAVDARENSAGAVVEAGAE